LLKNPIFYSAHAPPGRPRSPLTQVCRHPRALLCLKKFIWYMQSPTTVYANKWYGVYAT
jgi:hypothetical protein